MSNRLIFALIVMVLVVGGMSACKPVCSPGELVAPQILNPLNERIFDDTTESLEWSWPNQNCVPEGYLLEIAQDGPNWGTPLHSVTLGGLTTSWNFPGPLPAATEYWWRISAFADGVYGPTTPDKQRFWTGPICPGSSLIAPDPFIPYENGVETNEYLVYSLRYDDPDCIPEGFELTVSRTEDMSDIVGIHDKFARIKKPTYTSGGCAPAIQHMDCTEYFWNVRAVSDGMEGPWSTVYRFTTDFGNGCSCSSNAITMAILREPADLAILPGSTAHLKWLNHGGCFPDGAVVQLATTSDFSNAIEISIAGQFVSEYEALNLTPATQYYWRVAYYMNGSGGPVIGTYSGPRSFYTGPECTSVGELTIPVRIAPQDNSVLNTDNPTMQFAPGSPGCIPDKYLLHLHEMADFSDPNLMGETFSPATSVPSVPLNDCTTYHWSVTAVQDGSYGPESDRGSFSVDLSGNCGQSSLKEGMEATAIKNNFCREGTFPEHHDVLWTFSEGQHALAIARNPFNTYLKLVVINQETKQPLEEFISCWSLFSAFEPGWTPPTGQGDFKELPIEDPPPTPIPGVSCSAYTNEPDCMADAGCDWKFTAGAPGGYCTEK